MALRSKRWRLGAIALWLAGSACGYTGHAHALTPEVWKTEPGWIAVDHVQLRHQHGEYDCGPTALQMVLDHWCTGVCGGRDGFDDDRRITAGELRDRARELGFYAYVVTGTFDDIKHELALNRPVIVGVAKPIGKNKAIAHYQVVVGIQPKTSRIATLDPDQGWRENTFAGFLEEWTPTKRLLLVMLPTQRTNACSTGSKSSALGLDSLHSAFSRSSAKLIMRSSPSAVVSSTRAQATSSASRESSARIATMPPRTCSRRRARRCEIVLAKQAPRERAQHVMRRRMPRGSTARARTLRPSSPGMATGAGAAPSARAAQTTTS